jgi:hypothetical protein
MYLKTLKNTCQDKKKMISGLFYDFDGEMGRKV